MGGGWVAAFFVMARSRFSPLSTALISLPKVAQSKILTALFAARKCSYVVLASLATDVGVVLIPIAAPPSNVGASQLDGFAA
jgi:predicted cation transporter